MFAGQHGALGLAVTVLSSTDDFHHLFAEISNNGAFRDGAHHHHVPAAVLTQLPPDAPLLLAKLDCNILSGCSVLRAKGQGD